MHGLYVAGGRCSPQYTVSSNLPCGIVGLQEDCNLTWLNHQNATDILPVGCSPCRPKLAFPLLFDFPFEFPVSYVAQAPKPLNLYVPYPNVLLGSTTIPHFDSCG